MKLGNIYLLCKEYEVTISGLVATSTIRNSRSVYHVTGWSMARDALIELRTIPYLNREAEKLLQAVPQVFMNKDQFELDGTDWSVLERAKNELRQSMQAVIRLVESMGVKSEEKVGLDVKIPVSQDFSEFLHNLQSLEFVFTKCTFLQDEKEKLVFKNVDVGSNWLTFVIVGASMELGSRLLNNIAAFIDKCIQLKSHKLTVKKQEQDLIALRETEEEKQSIRKLMEELYEIQVKKTIEELENITAHKVENKDGDEYKRIEHCMEQMGNLIDKGLQIYTTINAPQETKALFAPLEMKYLEVGKTIEKLEDKEMNETDA